MMISGLSSIREMPYEQSIKILDALNEDSIVTITDKNGTITYANKKFCEISKYSLSELIGQNHRILKSGHHPDIFFQNMWKTISQGKVWKGNVKNKAKDGSFYWVKTTIYPIVDRTGVIQEYVSIRTDITDQIKKQEQFNKSLQFLAKAKFLTNIYENSMGLCRTVDTDGYVIECNKSYADALGYTKEEIIGHTIYEHTAKQSLGEIEKIFHKWNATGTVDNAEIFLLRKDGTIFPALLSANSLYDANGCIIGSNTILRDITELYELRKKKEENEKMISLQLEELQNMSRQKNEFLAMITHELKTPLVPIISYTDLMLEKKLGDLTDKQQSSLNSIRLNSKSLLRLISDLLDLQKMELGTFKFQKDDFVLSELVKNCLSQLASEFNNKGIQLEQNLEDNLHCYCDSGRIMQTITNLLTNAIDFCPHLTGKITMTLGREGNESRLIVKDNGRGMTETELSKLFTKFYQADPSITREHGGTGLGLSICNAIVAGHGGRVSAKSEGLGKGTEIHVILPLANSLYVKKDEPRFEKVCHVCNNEMEPREGDVVFDGKWFHPSCWQNPHNELRNIVDVV